MTITLLLCAIVLLSCIIANRFSNRFGMPALLMFMALGMLFGSDGLFRISFDDYYITEQICTVALIFIMFYGGFCTKWNVAKPVAKKATLLSTVGVILTALFTCLFCHFILKISFTESFLLGAIVSSTDAASVFSILRSKKLSLKDGSASLLELESGSNDPAAYMLTMIGLTLLKGDSANSIAYMLFSQIVYGILIGVAVAIIALFILQKLSIVSEGLDAIFVIAIVLVSFALPAMVGGNGYLSAYLTGIIMGNSKIKNKTILVHFFDGITGLAQIMIFFLLGLLAFPKQIPNIAGTAILITLFLSLVARPVAVFALLIPFRCSIRQCLLISWAGLRGAASIVFAIMVIASGVPLTYDLYHIIFFVSLLSVAIQGSFLPYISRKLNMVDESLDISKTFNDYQEESSITMMRLFIPKGHNWENHMIHEVSIPTGCLVLMIQREEETLIPKGNTIILANDTLILSVPSYRSENEISLTEIKIDNHHKWYGKHIEELELPDYVLIAMIKREDETIIPDGKTIILEHDIVVIYNQSDQLSLISES